MDGKVDIRILGIDPGLNTTGYGIIGPSERGPRLVEAGVIKSTASRSLAARVHEIHEGVAEVIAAVKPGVLAMEQLYSHYERPMTAILMGHARGAICLAAAQAGIEVSDYAATRVKKLLTGNGRAPKVQMQETIRREFGLAEAPEPADVADALAIALCHFYMMRTVAI